MSHTDIIVYDQDGNRMYAIPPGRWEIQTRKNRRTPWRTTEFLTVPNGELLCRPLETDGDHYLIRKRAA